MAWVIYDSVGRPIRSSGAGYREYSEISIPDEPPAGRGRVFAPLLTGNDSLTPGTDKTGLFYRRSDGHMTKISEDFPYSRKMRHPYVATAPFGDSDEIALVNSWVNFSSGYSVAAFTKDFLGCVWMQGLIKSGTLGVDLLTLPEGYRNTLGSNRWPTYTNTGVFGAMDAHASGGIELDAGDNGYFGLVRIAFPVDGAVTWHEVGGGGEPAFENSWVNYGGSWDTAGFAKDALGRVWLKGLIKSGTTGTNAFTLPVGYRPTKSIMQALVANPDVMGRCVIKNDGSVTVSDLAGNNTYVSLACIFTADGEGPGWREIGAGGEPAFENSWENYGDPYDTAAFYKDAAGIVHIKGLIKLGSIGSTAFIMPIGYRPKQSHLIGAISANLIGRLQITENGAVVPYAGSNTWFSIDVSFVAEQ